MQHTCNGDATHMQQTRNGHATSSNTTFGKRRGERRDSRRTPIALLGMARWSPLRPLVFPTASHLHMLGKQPQRVFTFQWVSPTPQKPQSFVRRGDRRRFVLNLQTQTHRTLTSDAIGFSLQSEC